jgi:hypothetical protein
MSRGDQAIGCPGDGRGFAWGYLWARRAAAATRGHAHAHALCSPAGALAACPWFEQSTRLWKRPPEDYRSPAFRSTKPRGASPDSWDCDVVVGRLKSAHHLWRRGLECAAATCCDTARDSSPAHGACRGVRPGGERCCAFWRPLGKTAAECSWATATLC